METIEDIVREMRKDMPRVKDAKIILRNYADRLEAATKALEADRDNWREQAFAEASRANAATCNESRQVGNAAKMREALENVVEIAKREWNAFRETSAMYEMHEICTAALAEPLRNCDVGTAEEQYVRFRDMCVNTNCEGLVKHNTLSEYAFAWSQMPYESEVK